MRVTQLEEQLGLARILVDYLVKLLHHLSIKFVGVNRYRYLCQCTVLNSLEILDISDLKVVECTVAEALLQFGIDIHCRANLEHSRPFAPVFTEKGKNPTTVKILNGDKAARFSRLSVFLAYGGDDASYHHLFPTLQARHILHLLTGCVAEVVEYHLIFVKRMGREIDTHEITFFIKAFDVTPRFSLDYCRCRYLYCIIITEEGVLLLHHLRLIELTITHQLVDKHLSLGILREIIFTTQFGETVKATAKHKRLNTLSIAAGEAHTLDEVKDSLVGAVALTLHDDSLSSSTSHTFYGTDAETYLTLFVCAELLTTLVDVGSQCRDIHGTALVHEFGDFGDVVKVSTHHGSHIFGGIVSFEICRLI